MYIFCVPHVAWLGAWICWRYGRNGDVHGVLQVDTPPHRERRPHRLYLACARLGAAPRAGGAQGGSNVSEVGVFYIVVYTYIDGVDSSACVTTYVLLPCESANPQHEKHACHRQCCRHYSLVDEAFGAVLDQRPSVDMLVTCSTTLDTAVAPPHV